MQEQGPRACADEEQRQLRVDRGHPVSWVQISHSCECLVRCVAQTSVGETASERGGHHVDGTEPGARPILTDTLVRDPLALHQLILHLGVS